MPPPVEGVGSYALALAAALLERFGTTTRFLVGNPTWTDGQESAGGSVLKVAARSADDLAELLGDSSVLLHYVNYGYHPLACPLWLVEGLQRWRARGGGRRLTTIFHEVYAGGPPWRKVFWTSPLQRRLAATLARRSDEVATTLELYAQMLQPWIPGREITVHPVFSTVGEPANLSPLRERVPRLVVFGSSGVRGRAYTGFRQALAATCRELGIEEIADIGPPTSAASSPVEGVPLRRLGMLSAVEVSHLLRNSLAGFLAYPQPFLPKSTIFAAYCAHGVLPICSWIPRRGTGTLGKELTYWAPGGLPMRSADLQAVASRAHTWYSGHTLARQAALFHDLLVAANSR